MEQEPLSLELAKSGYKTYVSDISPQMIDRLQQRARKSGLTISTLLSNFNDRLPFEDNSFNAIVTASANRYITNLDTFLGEIYRILDHGGYFIWPILGADIIPWKRNAGLKQITLSSNLAGEMKKHGFTVVRDSIGSLFRNTLKGIPLFQIPSYLIGRKPAKL